MKKTTWIIAIIAVVVIVGAWFMTSYNSLVTANEGVDNQWAQVQTQYQRRFDLIPNLVSSVKGAMAQETAVFTAIAEARTRYSGATSVNDKASAASDVESSLSRLLVVMENYPQLKSIDTVTTLMAQLEGTENRISVERSRFNESVQSYNIMLKRFPLNMLAGMYGFSAKNYFEVAPAATVAPTVNLEVTK